MIAGIHTNILVRDLISMITHVLGISPYTRSYSRCLRRRCELEELELRAHVAKYMTLEDVFGNNNNFIKAPAYEHDVPAFSESLKYLVTVVKSSVSQCFQSYYVLLSYVLETTAEAVRYVYKSTEVIGTQLFSCLMLAYPLRGLFNPGM